MKIQYAAFKIAETLALCLVPHGAGFKKGVMSAVKG